MNFFRRTGVTTDAQDLVQQTFLRLYRYRGRYRPSAKFTTFLYLLARQVRTDLFRKKMRLREVADGLTHEKEPDPDPSAAASDTTARMEEALRRLPDGMRDVVVMGIMQGMGYEDIGRVLRIPTGTVKSRMFNALRKLRADIEESGETTG
jgi:RNA polymerase sigma-70 factor (ECF subfamily)